MRNKIRTLGIVGLGLLGGSLALAVKKRWKGCRVIGVSRRRQTIAEALRRKVIDRGATDLRILRECDFIVLATPISAVCPLLFALDHCVRPGTVVSDVSSVKTDLIRRIEREGLKRILFTGAHPMAGSHESGLGAARADLFEGCLVFLVPMKKTPQHAFRLVEDFWKGVSRGRVRVLSREAHDRLAAKISHLPHLVASSLAGSTPLEEARLSGPGFLDTTRVAAGDPHLWSEILQLNRKELVRCLAAFEGHLKRLRVEIKKGNAAYLDRFLERASSVRRKLSP